MPKIRLTRRRIVFGVVLLAAMLRLWAALQLPVDFDEPVYLQAAFDYARAVRAGDWNAVIDYPQNREHPALVKLLYGAGVLALGKSATFDDTLLAARLISVLFGTLAVFLLAQADPLAGFLLAIHTLTVKYTSQAYLEALPLFAAIAAVFALRSASSARSRRFYLSALALGLAAAGKLTYLPIVLVLAYIAVWEKRFRWRDLLLYCAVAVAALWLLNPTLWHDPLRRLADALFFHARYSQSAHVQQVGYPWYQPLLWISRSVPWHPEVFFYIGFDEIIFVLAVAGLVREWRRRRWIAVWIVTVLIVLLLWPTKWPQYTMVLIPALCMAASAAATWAYRWVREQDTYWQWFREMVPKPPRAFWVIAVAALVLISVGYAATRLEIMAGRRGWSHITVSNTLLPSNMVYTIAPGPGGQMILGTERGAAIWTPAASTDVPDAWTVFTAANSGLPNDRVLAVAQDEGALWFGTEAGLARYASGEWRVYRARDFGVGGEQVRAVALGGDGRVWVGTDAGASVFDGQRWMAYTAASGLADDSVMALAVQATPEGDAVWFGTQKGLSLLDTATGAWSQFALGPGGVADLMVDSNGRVWAATLGGGLHVWESGAWRSYNVSNSPLPSDTVRVVYESEPGVIWVGTAWPVEVGGALASFDGKAWKMYAADRTGFSGAEPLAMAVDAEGRLWIGTSSAGLDVYRAADR